MRFAEGGVSGRVVELLLSRSFPRFTQKNGLIIMIRPKFAAITACSAVLALSQFSQAEEPAKASTKPGQVGVQVNKADHHADGQHSDHMFASCLAIGNQEEVIIVKHAQEKLQNAEAKKFAKMMIEDHQAMLKKLAKWAPEATQEGYLSDKEGNSERANVPPAAVNVKVGENIKVSTDQAQNHHLAGIQIHREIAEECIRAAKAGMAEKEGAEFDKCFIGYQIAGHAMMKNTMVVFQRHATGELKQLLAEGITTTEKHMKKAEQIMRDLEGSRNSGANAEQKTSQK